MLLALAILSAQAGCTLDALDQALAGADILWEQDREAFGERARMIRSTVRCLNEPLTPHHAARVHQNLGLDASIEDAIEDSIRHFQSMFMADPLYQVPKPLVPPNEPVRYLIIAAEELPMPLLVPLKPAPVGASYIVDGHPGTAVPAGLPSLVQIDDPRRGIRLEDGTNHRLVLQLLSAGLAAGSASFAAGAIAQSGASKRATAAGDLSTATSKRSSSGLLGAAAGGLGVGAGITLAVSLSH